MSAKTVVFNAEAAQDLEEIQAWFVSQSGDALARRFLDMVEATTDRIGDHPELYAMVYKDYRQCRVPVFEYIVTYRVKDECVEILAVTHGKRAPSTWQSR